MAEPKRTSPFLAANARDRFKDAPAAEENSRVTPVMPLRAWTEGSSESQLRVLPPAVSVQPTRSIESPSHVAPAVHEETADAYSGEQRNPGTWANNRFEAEPITLVRPRESYFDELNMEAFPLIRRANRDFLSDGPALVRNSSIQPFWPANQELESEPEAERLPLRPPLWRRVFSKFLFVVIFSAVLALLVYEVALVYGITWSDVQTFTGRLTHR